nr:polyprenyl synthetase family protein [Microlunatus kandeliicorticis]
MDPADPVGGDLRAEVAAVLTDFLDGQRTATAALGPELDPLHRLATDLTAGGKRLRPALCVWGWVAAAGPDPAPADRSALFRAAASLELLHVSALVHDDVMDGSDLRRGRPSAHRQLEAWHREQARTGDPVAFGRAGAILLGDLLLMWSTEMLTRSGVAADRLEAAGRIAETMRTEVTGGQFLDVLAQTAPLLAPGGSDADATDPALAAAERVTEFKSARYTVVRPAQLGATLAGAGPALLARLEAYGLPLGRAFQYRDDLLGVFGDPELTGKPAGDDLREGKRTVLVAHARMRADAAGRAELDRRLGDPDLDADGVARLQGLIADSGAVEEVEAMIRAGHDAAVAALDAEPGGDLHPAGRQALRRLAELAVDRTA